LFVFLLAVGASIAASLWHLYWQPPIVVYDLFHGYFAGSIYDESLVGTGLHWIYRVYTVAFAVFMVALLELRRLVDRETERIVGVAAIAFVSFVVGFSTLAVFDDDGLRITREMIWEELGARIETEHFIIYASESEFDARDRRLLAADHEARYDELKSFWATEPEKKLRSFVYGNRDQKGRLMGGRDTLVAKVWLNEMHIVWSGVGDDLLAHEMSHLFLRSFGSGPLKLPNVLGVIPRMGLVEGSATAAAWGSSELNPHGWSAALLEIDLLPDIESTLTASEFWSQPSGIAYTALGSFSRWFIDEYGSEAFLRAYARGHFESEQGEGVSEYVRLWKQMLREQPLTPAHLEEARYTFDRPSIFGAKCPRAGAGWVEDAQLAARGGNGKRVLKLLEQLQSHDLLQSGRRFDLVEALFAVEEFGVAESLLLEVVEGDGFSIAQKQRARLKLADLAWLQGGDDEEISKWLRDIESEPANNALRRAVFVRSRALSVGGRIKEEVFSYLAADWIPRWMRVVSLVQANRSADSPVLQYLAGIILAGRQLEEAPNELLIGAREELRGSPVYRRLMRELAYHRSIHGQERACDDWRELTQVCEPVSACHAQAQMWLERCEQGWWPFEDLRSPLFGPD
jgi:hypothetical protein